MQIDINKAAEFAKRVGLEADRIAHEVGINGGEGVAGAAMFAGIVARAQCVPGHEQEIAQGAAKILVETALNLKTPPGLEGN